MKSIQRGMFANMTDERGRQRGKCRGLESVIAQTSGHHHMPGVNNFTVVEA